ncbi:MAG: DUF2089 domain-containing protein [Chloroflexota bacterium]
MRKILEECPSCGSDLVATELSCTACDTVVHGHFAPCRFCRLSPEDLAFLEVFVKNRGNVKEMERDLGISYWSIRNRLDEVVAAIDFEEAPAVSQREGVSGQRQEILERLDRGEITVAEATELLSRSEP